MDTTLTEFQRNFRAARAAADRGETVAVKSGAVAYLFMRSSQKPKKPFADLEPLFGVVRLPLKKESNREGVRRRLKARGGY
jgi:hypothetical protein